MSGNVTRKQVLGLYTSMLRASKKLQDYNFRDHAQRRIKYGFRHNYDISPYEATKLYEIGKNQLVVLTRQAVISQLYPIEPSVLESSDKSHKKKAQT